MRFGETWGTATWRLRVRTARAAHALALVVLAANVASGCGSPTSGRSAVVVTDPWIRETAEGQTSTAAYATLTNPTKAPISLVGASVALAATVEIHEMRLSSETGSRSPERLRAEIMGMARVESVVIPPGGRVVLTTGGLHLMLIGLGQRCMPGERVPMEFRFSDGTVSVTAEVGRRLATEP